MYHIILNPVSGKKKALKNLRVLEEQFQQNGVGYELHKTCAVRDAEDIARHITEQGAEKLIVLGGDGTLHEVLNGIVDPSRCTLGLIPSGTGNDFAGKIGIPLKAEKAVHKILGGQAREIDYLDVGGVRCMNVAGLGMDVDVLERCQRGKMKGKIKYLMSLIKSLFAFKGYPIIVYNDGKEETHDALLAAVCNGSQFGGGIRICPDSVVDDGKIDVVVVECIGSKMKIIKAFIELMKGKILSYHATTHFRAEQVRFQPKTPCTVQLDGELYRGLDFNVKLCKGLKMYY